MNSKIIVTNIAVQKGLLYLTVVAGVIGVAFLAVDLGPFHLFPYRILLPLLWMLFVMRLLLNQGRMNVSHIKVAPYLQFLMLWLLYAVVSLAWAGSKGDAIREIIFLFMAVSISFFVVYYFRSLKDLKRFYDLWLLILLPLLGLGFWNHLTGNQLSVSSLVDVLGPGRFAPTAVFYNQNHYATHLVLSIPFVLAFIRYNNNYIKRLLGIVLLVAALYLLVVTFSRANYLAVIMGATFCFFFLLRFKGKMKALAVTSLVVVLLFAAFPGQVHDTFQTITAQLATFKFEEAAFDVRINLVRNSLVFLRDHLGFGVGAGNVEYYMTNFQVYDTRGIIDAHNWWVEILVNYGILIFMGYVAFYLSLFARLYKAYGKLTNISERMICEALLVGLVSFFFAMMSNSSHMALRSQWLFLAFALGFLNYYRIKQVRDNT